GQSVTFSSIASGGTGPYTYNFIVFNSVTNTIIANQIGSSNSFAFTSNANLAGNTLKSNVIVTDSATTPTSANSIDSGLVTVTSGLSVTIAPSTATNLDAGQSLTFTASAIGGTSPYTYNFIVFNSITHTIIANQLGSSNSFAFTSNTNLVGNTLKSNVIVTDSATIPSTTNSIDSGLVTVNSAVSATIAPSSATLLDAGQSVTFSSIASGGTGPYTYNFIVFNSITNTIVASQLGSSSSFIFASNGNLAGNTLKSNVVVTDSATVPTSANSINSGLVTVNSALSATIAPSTATNLNAGQSVTFSSIASGGTGPYTYNFIVFNSVTNTIIANQIGSSNSFAFTSNANLAGNTLKSNVIVTDSATTPTSANSIDSGLVTVTSGLSVTIAPSTATNLDAGQSLTFTASAIGGTSPYTYNFIVFNSITHTIIANQLGSSNSFAFTSNTNLVGNTLKSNVIVVDSATVPNTANSVDSGLVTVNSVPTLSISASNTLLDSGQSVTWTITANGGTGAHFDTQLLNQTGSSSQVQSNVLILTLGGSNTISFVTKSPVQGNTFSYNALSTDLGTTVPYAFNSITSSITVNSVPSVSSFTQSNSALAVNDFDTYTLTLAASSGTGPFTVNFVYTNNGVVANTVSGVAIGGSASNTIQFTTGGTYTINAIVTDAGTTTSYLFNSVTLTSTVGNQLSIAAPTPSSQSVTQGGTATITATAPTTGTSPYTYQWLEEAPGAGSYTNSADCASPTTLTCSFATTTSTTTGTYSFEIKVTDSASTPATATSGAVTVTVNTAGAALSVTGNVINATIYAGQQIALNSTASGGTAPYTYQWFNLTSNTPVAMNGVGSNSIGFTFNSFPGSVGNFIYFVKVFDSASANAISSNVLVTVNALPIQTNSFSITSSTNTVVNFANANSVFTVTTNSPSSSGNVIVQNVTTVTYTAPTPPAQSTYGKLAVLNISFNKTAGTSLTIATVMAYPCNLAAANITVQEFNNSAWSTIPFTVNSTACTVNYTIYKDPIIGLFFQKSTQTTTTTTTTIPAGSGAAPAAGGGGGVAPTAQITSIPSLQFITAPLYSSVGLGTSALLVLGLQNTGIQGETVHLSIPESFQSMLQLSTSSLYILPNQQVSIQLTLKPNATLASGVYILPLNVSLNNGGPIVNQTEYLAFNLYSSANSSAQLISQIQLQNNTDAAQGTIQVSNPTPNLLTNLTLQTLIPKALVGNVSEIHTTGLLASISDIPGYYMVVWQIPQISPLTSVYGYYTIYQPQSQRLLQSIRNVLAQPASSLPAGVLKVVNIAFPTFYVNSTGQISLFAVYTGVTPEPISFILTGPPGILIDNPSASINSTYNKLLNPTFNVRPIGSAGKYLLTLFVSTDGFNATYSLPLTVLPISQSPSAQLSSSIASMILAVQSYIAHTVLVLGAVAAIALIVVIYLLSKYVRLPILRRNNSDQLERLREQIKGGARQEEPKGEKGKKPQRKRK
ncbi:MAG: hypothetical protein KGH71_04200, partial [Candidatus Micrarchaeota archaeon]|nr:hypothetical protein [Candidatus Micrarchaeota archaeon]